MSRHVDRAGGVGRPPRQRAVTRAEARFPLGARRVDLTRDRRRRRVPGALAAQLGSSRSKPRSTRPVIEGAAPRRHARPPRGAVWTIAAHPRRFARQPHGARHQPIAAGAIRRVRRGAGSARGARRRHTRSAVWPVVESFVDWPATPACASSAPTSMPSSTCARDVDGLPLVVEIRRSASTTSSRAEIAERLRHGTDVPIDRGTVARHVTARGETIRWSCIHLLGRDDASPRAPRRVRRTVRWWHARRLCRP